MYYVLGIDLGTSGVKVALFDTDGRLKEKEIADYPLDQPENGWAEQCPENWWLATSKCIRSVLHRSRITPSKVVGVGLSGQMHGLVMLDSKGQTLRPAIIWCDQRTKTACNDFADTVGRKHILRITGNPPTTSFTAAKLMWVKAHQPSLLGKCRHILLPKDYIRYKLTGKYATDFSDASGTQLMDVQNRTWSSEILDHLHIEECMLPALFESSEIASYVTSSSSLETGLLAGTPVIAGAGDNHAAAIGTGVISAGDSFMTIGTSAVNYMLTKEACIDPKGRLNCFCSAVPEMWTLMSCTQAAGLSLKWFKDTFCTDRTQLASIQNIDPYKVMDVMAEQIPIGSEKLIFLPYLMGERSPHMDSNARGVFFGISPIHTKAHFIRAVLEGVAYSQLDCLEVFQELGMKFSDVTITGGGGKSQVWREIFANIFGIPINRLFSDEGGAFGAAILAAVGVGFYKTVGEATSNMIKIESKNHPDADSVLTYQPYYSVYKNLYPALKKSFEQISALQL